MLPGVGVCGTRVDAAGAYKALLMNESPTESVIAIVDDDESVREALESLAESVGYVVALFASAEDFWAASRQQDNFVCLILDVRLPGMSGVELYSRLTAS